MYKFLALEILLLAGLVFSYFDWRKEKSSLKSSYIWLCFVGMIELLCQESLAVVTRHLSRDAALWVDYWPNLIFWIAAGIFLVFITIKSSRKGFDKVKVSRSKIAYLILMVISTLALITASVYFWPSIYGK